MSAELLTTAAEIVSAVLAVAAIAYLIVALVRPERF
ncbi:K(+)-transporting ATPase subunit F [Leifsonia sp. NPDC058292]